MDLRSELEAIRKKHGGRLTPTLVVKDARKPDHPLHSRFEWDDAIAGEAYRVEQARRLIKIVMVAYTKPNGEVGQTRAFRAIRAADTTQFTYDPIEEILADKVRRQILFSDMQRQIDELVTTYEGLDEFWDYLRKIARRRKAS